MAGASPKQAVENFVKPLQRALSCVTTAVIDRQRGHDLRMTYALTVNGGAPVRLVRVNRRADIAIRIAQQYRVVQAEGDRGPLKVHQTRCQDAAGATGERPGPRPGIFAAMAPEELRVLLKPFRAQPAQRPGKKQPDT